MRLSNRSAAWWQDETLRQVWRRTLPPDLRDNLRTCEIEAVRVQEIRRLSQAPTDTFSGDRRRARRRDGDA